MGIQRLGLILRGLAWGAALLVVALPPLVWTTGLAPAFGPWEAAAGAAGLSGLTAFTVAVLMAPYAAVAWGLVQLAGFCRQLARGSHFSRSASYALRRFGAALVVAAVLLPITRAVALLAVTGSPGWSEVAQSVLRVQPLLATALALILGLIMVVFAAILDQATQLADENASFL